jgi:hypothetical protein
MSTIFRSRKVPEFNSKQLERARHLDGAEGHVDSGPLPDCRKSRSVRSPSSYPVLSKTVSCPAKSSFRCAMDKLWPSGDKDQQSQKYISRVPNRIQDSITSSGPSQRADPRTAMPVSRLLSCSPLVQHLKITFSSLPSIFVTTISSCSSGSECSILTETAFGGGPKNLHFDKFAFQLPEKLMLMHSSRPFKTVQPQSANRSTPSL